MIVRPRLVAVAVAVSLAPLAFMVLSTTPATAHGSMSDPPSRAYVCRFLSGSVENPNNAACQAALAAGGSQAFYDWHEVSLLTVGGRHRETIPDGRLCSAGRDKYRGLDLQRTDWPAKRISPGNLTITYHATAPHANSNFEFYITRQGWNPSLPLSWSDLVHIRTFTNQNPTTFTNWTITIPQRTGRHILYSIWQRVVGSDEAFYTCSDVDFGGETPPPTTPPPTTPPPTAPPPTTQPPTSPPPTTQPPSGTWQAGTSYQVGARVTYGGLTYQCRQAHTALPGWEPPVTPALWLRL